MEVIALSLYTVIDETKISAMAGIEIPDLDNSLKSRLRDQAAMHGRSVEDEVRDILRAALSQPESEPTRLGSAINALFKPLGGLDLPTLSQEPIRHAPSFDE